MKKTNKIILVTIVVVILLLGIGYAAINNVTLNIDGTAKADPSQSNFKVMFSGTPKVSDVTKVTASITNDTNATINVSGLTKKGETASATYTVQNASTDISADLSVATTNSNAEFFTLKSELAKTSLTAGEATTLTVTVELTKIPITGTVSSTIGVQTTATPVEPGKEGTSGNVNGSSQTPVGQTLADVTNENIGDYIDLGNNVVGTSSTTDDWRIFYKEENTVYAILADKLSDVSKYITEPEVYDYDKVAIYASTVDKLINQFNSTSWNQLANEISGAKVMGTPTAELFMKSYNIKNKTNLNYTDTPQLNTEIKEYDLYTAGKDSSHGLWLATAFDQYNIYNVSRYGDKIEINASGYASYRGSNTIKPVVALPSNTKAELVNGVWKIIK